MGGNTCNDNCTATAELLSGHAFEVAVATGGEEEGEEDGEVVAGVDEGGAGYGAGADADEGEDERATQDGLACRCPAQSFNPYRWRLSITNCKY